jgi:hypothetical protein
VSVTLTYSGIKKRRPPGSVLVLSAVILLGSIPLLSSCSPGKPESPAEETPPEAAEQREFPPFVYNSAQTLKAYTTAVQIAEVLPLMPCYCNCGEAHGHKSLKDCFFKEDGSFNDHGAFCEICDREVADIAQWQEEGHTLERIRELIDEKYPAWGEPTDTPNPFRPKVSPTGEAPSADEPVSESWVADFSGGPRIAFREQRVEIGRWPFDVPIDYRFHFKNVGDEPLEISRVLARALAGC